MLYFELTDNQKNLLNVILKEKKEENTYDILDKYSNCSLEGDSWIIIEEDIIILKKILLAIGEEALIKLLIDN